MANRRRFVPGELNGHELEGRLAPSNIFGLGHDWDKFVTNLGFHHHHDTGNTAAIKNLWANSEKLSKPIPAAAHAAPAKHPIHFK